MLLPLSIAALLALSTVLIHYEVLRGVSGLLQRSRLPVRLRMLLVVIGCFGAHTIEVWIYAATYYGLSRAGVGSLGGRVDDTFAEYLYFSISAYSTLGIGDIYPEGALRLISGVEALNGLFLIAWSTSFTYLAMEKLWPLHLGGQHRRALADEDDGAT